MGNWFPARYSRLEPAELAVFAAEYWDLPAPVSCIFFHSGENDGYRLKAAGHRYFLRVYRTRHSTPSRVDAELILLDELKVLGLPVSAPIATKDGRLWAPVFAAEGERAVAIFDFAEGTPLKRDEPRGWEVFGEELARLHLAEGKLVGLAHYGPEQLLFEPARGWIERISSIGPGVDEVRQIAGSLGGRLEPLWKQLPCGLVHGDTAGGNAHLDTKGNLMWFDFLWTNLGPFAWDLGTFRRGAGEIESNWSGFLVGYESVRRITDAEFEALPLLAAVRCIYTTALIIDECEIDLHAEATPAWFERRLVELRRLEDRTRESATRAGS